jgi:muramoyltetrapeptide carboxypeptidase
MRVKVVAPAGPPAAERLQAGRLWMEQQRWQLEGELPPASPNGTATYLSAADEVRAQALIEALRSDVDVVWCARGGYGMTRLLPVLDAAFPSSASMPTRIPTVVGFSDITALFAWMHCRGLGDRCVHGPLFTTIALEDAAMQQRFHDVVRGHVAPPLLVRSAHHIDVRGPLFAGNLCVLAALCGTSAMPTLEGHVLVLEEVGEAPYRIDRMMTQLSQSGALNGVRALVVGHLTNCIAPTPTGTSAVDVMEERCAAIGVPVAHGLCVGHETPNAALPLGGEVQLRVNDGVGSLAFEPRLTS